MVVVTDSTAYLPRRLVDELDIRVISLLYQLEGQDWRHDLDPDGDHRSFYAALEAADGVATTKPAPPGDFRSVYEPLLDEGLDVVSIHISSAMSQTIDAARQAQQELAADGFDANRIEIVDSAGSAGHLGAQALAAATAAAAGADRTEVIARTQRIRQEVKTYFTVETLEYLKRGGRIGTAAAWLGSTLNVKPILTLESEITAIERVRTRSRSMQRLVQLTTQRQGVGSDAWGMNHALYSGEVDGLVERVSTILGRPPTFVSEFGPVLGTHLGPGAIALTSFPSRLVE